MAGIRFKTAVDLKICISHHIKRLLKIQQKLFILSIKIKIFMFWLTKVLFKVFKIFC